MPLSNSDSGPNRVLRLGLVGESPILASWIIPAVDLARATGLLSIDRFFLLATPDHTASTGSGQRQTASLRALYDGFDARWSNPNRDAPVGSDKAPAWLPPPVETTLSDLVELARKSHLDALLWLAGPPPPLPFAETVPMGIWRWRFGVSGDESALESSFQTILTDSPITTVRLTALHPQAEEQTLASYVGNSVRFSSRRTLSEITLQAGRLLPRAVANALANRVESQHEEDPPAKPTLKPTGGLGVQFMRLGLRYAQQRLKAVGRLQQWALAFHRGSAASGPALDPSVYTHMIPPRDRDWADPFPVHHEGVDWIFFEELEYSRGLGHLSVAPLGTTHFTAKPVPIIVEDFHLSYPFVFAHDGEFYLLPESAERGSLQLYRATRFPFEWVRDRVLMEGPTIVDATLADIDGSWWMFACSLERGIPPWSELHLFKAPSPFGPWMPHRRNPVIADVRHARPAGRLFRRDGMWYRPTQDCSVAYGYALSLRRIDVLSEDDFQETAVARMDPTWEPQLCGVHTLNMSGPLTLIDVRRRVRP